MSNILVPLFLPFTFRDDSILTHSSKNKATVQGILGENVSRNGEFFFLLKLSITPTFLPTGAVLILSWPFGWVLPGDSAVSLQSWVEPAATPCFPGLLQMPGVDRGEADDAGRKRGACIIWSEERTPTCWRADWETNEVWSPALWSWNSARKDLKALSSFYLVEPR